MFRPWTDAALGESLLLYAPFTSLVLAIMCKRDDIHKTGSTYSVSQRRQKDRATTESTTYVPNVWNENKRMLKHFTKNKQH